MGRAGASGCGQLDAVAARWLAEVRAHRRKAGVYGKVEAAVVSTPAGEELHLLEETTFRAGPAAAPAGEACPADPLAAALAWLGTQAARRREFGAAGTVRVEATDRNGVVNFARVVEITVISGGGVDAAAPPR